MPSNSFGTGIGPDGRGTGHATGWARCDATYATAIGGASRATAAYSIALGKGARATKVRAIAIGRGSIADAANTISVGRKGGERRIVNVAAGKRPTDAVNVAQLKAAVAAVAAGASPAVAVPVAPTPPAVSVVAVGAGSAKRANDDIRRELVELRALVKQQQQRIAQLESRVVAAAK